MTDLAHATYETPASNPDPETLVIRGQPKPVIRFRRGVIIGASTLVLVAIMGTTWFALRPASFIPVVSSEDAVDTVSQRTPDMLAGAPRTYGDIQELGPPLPGDLGRPILAHQEKMATQDSLDTDNEAARLAQVKEAERQRRTAELKAAREAAILVQISTSQPNYATQDAALASLKTASATGENLAPKFVPDGDSGRQQGKEEFANSVNATSAINPNMLEEALSPWMIHAGSVIAASLITGLNSDLPGMVAAQVTENVRDSVTGRTILIPQGSRLIGKYDHEVAFGQSRALLVWQRLILPDGSSIGLDNAPATDAAGYAGLSDKVDFHTWALLKGIGLSTLLGVGTQLSLDGSESDLVRALRESVQGNADRAGQQITSRNLDIQPTIKIRPGFPVRVMVHKDLILKPQGSSAHPAP